MSFNIIRRRGDTFPHVIQLIDKGSGDPIDITGDSFQLAVDASKEPATSSNNIMQLTGVITDGPDGTVEFSPSAGEADNVGNFFYDIERTVGGKVRTIENGKFILKQDISK